MMTATNTARAALDAMARANEREDFDAALEASARYHAAVDAMLETPAADAGELAERAALAMRYDVLGLNGDAEPENALAHAVLKQVASAVRC